MTSSSIIQIFIGIYLAVLLTLIGGYLPSTVAGHILFWTPQASTLFALLWLWCRRTRPVLANWFKLLSFAGVVLLLALACLKAGTALYRHRAWTACTAHPGQQCLLDRTEVLLRSGPNAPHKSAMSQLLALKFAYYKQLDQDWRDYADGIVRLTARRGDTAGVARLLSLLDVQSSAPSRIAAAEEFSTQPDKMSIAIALLNSVGDSVQSGQYANIVARLTERGLYDNIDALLSGTEPALLRRLLDCADCERMSMRSWGEWDDDFDLSTVFEFDCGDGALTWPTQSPLAEHLLVAVQKRASAGDLAGARMILAHLGEDRYRRAAGQVVIAAVALSLSQPDIYRAVRQEILEAFAVAGLQRQIELATHGLALALSAGDAAMVSTLRSTLLDYISLPSVSPETVKDLALAFAWKGQFDEAERLATHLEYRTPPGERPFNAADQQRTRECFALVAAKTGQLTEASRRLRTLETLRRREWATLLLAAAEQAYVEGNVPDMSAYCVNSTGTSHVCWSAAARVNTAVTKERNGKTEEASAELTSLVDDFVATDENLNRLIRQMCQSVGRTALGRYDVPPAGMVECAAQSSDARITLMTKALQAWQRCAPSGDDAALEPRCTDDDMRTIWEAASADSDNPRQNICEFFSRKGRLPLLLALNAGPLADMSIVFSDDGNCIATLAEAGYTAWILKTAELMSENTRAKVYMRLAEHFGP